MTGNSSESEYYRGDDLVNQNKKILLQKITAELNKQEGLIAMILSQKEKNDEQLSICARRIEELKIQKAPVSQILWREHKHTAIDHTQSILLGILQPKFNDVFHDIAADPALGGLGYNLPLISLVRLDFIFGERDTTGPVDGERNQYWTQQENVKEKNKKLEGKVRIPAGHVLVTEDNYVGYSKLLATHMESIARQYIQRLGLEKELPGIYTQVIEKYFLYILMQARIDTKVVFDVKSTHRGHCLYESVQYLIDYFEDSLHNKFQLDSKHIKKKLWANLKDNDNPIDLSYDHALLRDIDTRENYLETTYFIPQKTSIAKVRKAIMEEYTAQKGKIEKTFELLNPLYHIYEDNIETHARHLEMAKHYQSLFSDVDPRIDNIIADIKEKMVYTEAKKKEQAVFEERNTINPKDTITMTEIQQKYLKKYKIPIQYWHIFGIVINKLNDFYRIKIGLLKKANLDNKELLDELISSDRQEKNFMYYLENYLTNKDIDTIFNEKRAHKRSERITQVKNDIQKNKNGGRSGTQGINFQGSLEF